MRKSTDRVIQYTANGPFEGPPADSYWLAVEEERLHNYIANVLCYALTIGPVLGVILYHVFK